MKETEILELNILLAMLNQNYERARELAYMMTPSERTALGIAVARIILLLKEEFHDPPSF